MTAPKLPILTAGLAQWGLTLTAVQVDRFHRYQTLLQEWNERINLTAVTDPAVVQSRHFLDSLSCSLVTGSLNQQTLIDIGAGAGFPGLPLKILYPEMHLTLVESVTKKCHFLQVVVAALDLGHVTIVNDRVEIVGHNPAHREQYDWATARAVASLPVLVEYLLPLCHPGGQALAMKGESAPAELAGGVAVAKLGGGVVQLHPVSLPGDNITAYLVTIPKIDFTPGKYPRRPGIPAKRPLT